MTEELPKGQRCIRTRNVCSGTHGLTEAERQVRGRYGFHKRKSKGLPFLSALDQVEKLQREYSFITFCPEAKQPKPTASWHWPLRTEGHSFWEPSFPRLSHQYRQHSLVTFLSFQTTALTINGFCQMRWRLLRCGCYRDGVLDTLEYVCHSPVEGSGTLK